MIYQPQLIYDLYRIFGASIVRAIQLAAGDYAVKANQPWSYYLGVALGYAALATGVKGAAAYLHMIAKGFDQVFFQSPSGSIVRVFIDGILRAEFSTYSPVSQWVTQHFDFADYGDHQVLIINQDIAPGNATGIPWLALGAATSYDGIILEANVALVDIVSYQLLDASGKTGSMPFYIPVGATLASLQAFSDGMAPVVDALVKAVITGSRVELALGLPAGLKSAALSPSALQEGALISFSAVGTKYAYGEFVPGIIDAALTGNKVNFANSQVDAFVQALITGPGATLLRAADRNGNSLSARKSGVQSFRKIGKRSRK